MGELFNQKKCIVAWIDILGTTAKIRKKSTTVIFDLWSYWHSVIKIIPTKVKYKIFSDNMLLCEEINDNEPTNAIQDIINIVQFLETMMINSTGDFIRGAISIGNIYIDENFVLGDALLCVYDIETKSAIYPRIVIDNSVFKYIPSSCQLFKQDTDGLYYYNFMNSAGWKHNDDSEEKPFINLKNFKEKVIKNCLENEDNHGVLQKMKWLVNYIQEYCDEKKIDGFTDEEIRIVKELV